MSRWGRLAASGVVVLIATGCGGHSSPSSAQASSSSSQPTCSHLIGETLTRAMEATSCRVNGALQITADVKCKQGTMVAFGNAVGGYIGQRVRAGNFATWPGCSA